MKPLWLFKVLREKKIVVQSHQRVKCQIYNLTIVPEHISAKSIYVPTNGYNMYYSFV